MKTYRGNAARRPAPTSSYVVCAHFGLDTGERSFPYVATWAKDKDVLRKVLGTIQTASATLIEGVRAASGRGPARGEVSDGWQV